MDRELVYQNLEKALKNYRYLDQDSLEFFNSFYCIQQKSNKLTQKELQNFFTTKLEELKKINSQNAEILFDRYIKNQSAQKISNEKFLSKDQVNRYKRKGLTTLTDMICDEEAKSRENHKKELFINFSSKTEFFGHKSLVENIKKMIITKTNQSIFVVSGIGGIGKSSITKTVIHMMIEQTTRFRNYHWIRLPNNLDKKEITLNNFIVNEFEQYSSKMNSSLIVIDNIATKDQFSEVLDVINSQFYDDVSFILTSRYRPIENDNFMNFWVPELLKIDSEILFRYKYHNNLSETSSGFCFEELYDLIGGNPLAIELVASLLKLFPFEVVKEELVGCNLENIESLYRKIYLKSWMSLSNDSKNCLVAMPVFLDIGISIEHLEFVTQFSKRQLLNSIAELYEFSLIELRGTFREKSYGIHHLTNSFLTTEIINE